MIELFKLTEQKIFTDNSTKTERIKWKIADWNWSEERLVKKVTAKNNFLLNCKLVLIYESGVKYMDNSIEIATIKWYAHFSSTE